MVTFRHTTTASQPASVLIKRLLSSCSLLLLFHKPAVFFMMLWRHLTLLSGLLAGHQTRHGFLQGCYLPSVDLVTFYLMRTEYLHVIYLPR